MCNEKTNSTINIYSTCFFCTERLKELISFIIVKKYKFGQGFNNFSRTQLVIFWLLIGFSLGVCFVLLVV